MTDLTAHEARRPTDAEWRIINAVQLVQDTNYAKGHQAVEALRGTVNGLLADLAASRALVEQMREAGQALRDAFPDSSWQHSAAIADAADVWDALAAVPDPQEWFCSFCGRRESRFWPLVEWRGQLLCQMDDECSMPWRRFLEAKREGGAEGDTA